jgi:hypothetical protein
MNTTQPEVYKGHFDRWIYKTLPPTMRVAKTTDFVDSRGVEIAGVHFLVHSYHSNHYEHHISAPGVIEKFKPWIDDNRCYVTA